MPKRKKGFYSVAEIDASPQLAAELLEFGADGTLLHYGRGKDCLDRHWRRLGIKVAS